MVAKKKSAPKKSAPKKSAPKKSAPNKVAPNKAAPTKVASSKAASSKAASSKAASSKAASSKAASSKAASSKVASSKAASSKAAPSKAAATESAARKSPPKKPAPKKSAGKTPAPVATEAEREALRASMVDYASNNYPIVELRFPACECGGDRFLVGGEDGTCAMRQCEACKREHPIADSAEYFDEADTEQCFCTCEHGVFQVGVGFAITTDKKDLRWIYVGGRCVHCGLAGVYLDWKIDYGPSLHLMDQA